MSEREAALYSVSERWGLGRLTLVGSGLEFSVYRGEGKDGQPMALRLAHRRFDSNANDPEVDTRRLLIQEYEITRHLVAHGFPVAEPMELVLADEQTSPDVLLSKYVSDDGSDLDQLALGDLLARLHNLPVPRLSPVASDGLTTSRVIAGRIKRRWAEVGRCVDEWPQLDHFSFIVEQLNSIGEGSLVHLDVRSSNLRRRRGQTIALVDWSNALFGDSRVEFGRLIEYARYPENGLDLEAIRRGYATTRVAPDESDVIMLLCRLDAALMLALVFLCEAPDPSRGQAAADYARELKARVDSLARG